MNLEDAIESLCTSYSPKELKKAFFDLSDRYRSKKAHETELHRIAYLATRLPATCAVLKRVFSEISLPPTIIDCGAGPGTSIWALLDQPISSLTLIEQDHEFVKLGKKMSPEFPKSMA